MDDSREGMVVAALACVCLFISAAYLLAYAWSML
jgi:hypothetical protein